MDFIFKFFLKYPLIPFKLILSFAKIIISKIYFLAIYYLVSVACVSFPYFIWIIKPYNPFSANPSSPELTTLRAIIGFVPLFIITIPFLPRLVATFEESMNFPKTLKDVVDEIKEIKKMILKQQMIQDLSDQLAKQVVKLPPSSKEE